MLVALILGAGLLMSEGVPEDQLSGKDFLTEFGDPLFDDTLNLEQSEEERVLERVLATRTNTQSDVARLNDAQVSSGASDASPAELAKKVKKLVTGKLSDKYKCTTDKGDCKFPFKYNGVSYDKCTEKASKGKPWCYMANGKTFGYCPKSCSKKPKAKPVKAKPSSGGGSCGKANDDDSRSNYKDRGGRNEFTVPLYMFRADSGEVATLTADAKLNTLNKVACKKYTKLFNGPVGFISATETATANRKLFAWWNDKTQDMYTSTADPSSWSKDYSAGVLLGYISYYAFSGNAPGAAPLYCYWNSKLKDNMLAPFTAAKDVNDLVSGNGWTMYGSKEYIGNMALGTCDACFTEVARTFGNKGGPGCPKSRETFDMGIVWDLSGYNSGLSGIQRVANQALRLMKGYGSISTYTQSDFHLAFNYFCGLSGNDKSNIKWGMKNCGVNWAPTLKFKGLSYEYNKPGRFSMVAVLDDESEAKMQKAGKAFERCLKNSAGVTVNIPRAHQWSYHLTLAQVYGVNKYAGSAAVRYINNQLDWSSATADLSDAGGSWCSRKGRLIIGSSVCCTKC